MLPSELLHIHRDKILEIFSHYPKLSNLRIIGSVAHGKDTKNSDIDFLIDAAPGTTLFDIGGLHEDLKELLGIPVDIIISGNHLSEYMQMTIKDAIPV